MTDWLRYNELVGSAVFNMEAWRGTFADQSRNRLAMSAVGTPGWASINGLPIFIQRANGDGAASGVTSQVADITNNCAWEFLVVPRVSGTDGLWYQAPANGGSYLYWDGTNTRLQLVLYDAAGVIARTIRSATSTVPTGVPIHVLIQSLAGGTNGLIWVRGLPVAVTLGGAGVVAAGGNATLTVGGLTTGLCSSMAIRSYNRVFTNTDASVLYSAARDLTVGEV